MNAAYRSMMGNMKSAQSKIQAAIKIHTGHMESEVAPSKESEKREMELLKGALAALDKCM